MSTWIDRTSSRRVLLGGLAAALLPCSTASPANAGDAGAVGFSPQEQERIYQHSPLPPLPADPTNRVADFPPAVRLGQFLYFDRRLSANGEVSCATCHDPAKGLADENTLAEGVDTGTRHSQAVWNMAYNRWFFWDGRADTLWSQALIPTEGPAELGSTRLQLIHLLSSDNALRSAYEHIFGPLPNFSDESRFPKVGRPVPDDDTHPHHRVWSSMDDADQLAVNTVYANSGKCVAAYERRLLSKDSPFDVFVEGLRGGDPTKMAALSASAQRGLKLFIGRGNCRICHSGPNFTDGEFHDIRMPPLPGQQPTDSARYQGVVDAQGNPFNAAGQFSDDREGAAAKKLSFLVQKPEQWGQFKTPSLRSVALSAPYMHQGQKKTLRDVLHHYSTLEGALPPGHHGQPEQLIVPLQFTIQEMEDLQAFLIALTGAPLDPKLLEQPASPVWSEL